MASSIPAEARRLKQLLQNSLIPLAQSGAPSILFDAPPRSSQPVAIREELVAPLPPPSRRKSYPTYSFWPEQRLNSISVPVLGCVYEGEADYEVRPAAPQQKRRWIVPVRAGTLFTVAPDTPFTADKLAWERPAPEAAYARGVAMHLRRDGIHCHSYTMDRGRVWRHPSLFLHEGATYMLGERLLQEWRRPGQTSYAIIHYYFLLILHLMQRNLHEGRYIVRARRDLETSSFPGTQSEAAATSDAMFQNRVHLAQEYIAENLEDPRLTGKRIALYTGLSQRHLNRLFQAEAGVLLSHYVRDQRLEKARLLLKTPGISIRQVAYFCGFRQPSHFSAWFSRHHRCSPTAYRRKSTKCDVPYT